MAGVDPREFRVFDSGAISDGAPSLLHASREGFAGDQRRVFFHQSTYPSAWEVKSADAASFVSMGGRYGRDNSSVFYEQRMVRHAKPRSFRLIGLCGYSADDQHVYFAGKEIVGADPVSFVVLWCYTLMAARDKHRYYYMGKPSTRDDYVKLLEGDARRQEEHIAEVRSGQFDDRYRKGVVNFRA